MHLSPEDLEEPAETSNATKPSPDTQRPAPVPAIVAAQVEDSDVEEEPVASAPTTVTVPAIVPAAKEEPAPTPVQESEEIPSATPVKKTVVKKVVKKAA